MNIIMVSGGVRSGKSAYAEKLVEKLVNEQASVSPPTKVLYVATGMRSDGEMDTRIEAHQQRRPESWDTLEAPNELSADPYKDYDIVLVDTLTAWIGNQLFVVPEERIRDRDITESILMRIHAYIDELKQLKLHSLIIVTDEVGWGGIAMSPLGRWFQDVIGEANQLLAASADEVFAVISGLPWRLKG
ncbi:bifunctional adenosylcobinamide kinase/adenosylcobinamide-phosphate guanylyltransferase [Cohnella sp. WQ 127256]|uniref:bifunctional adenosylcobinamide kinase/adenosylcobinamide-phosphate guanylyltransferase n=1 Tax=Cohnella sp. WQ 127256 TaxID=2938790 RepID=UPI002118FA1F|nr:bifunctional adenosylcobinamide kinase/adenosylcobinamide-phosphate guanylyltransferase [Cohnella sp. WQ 127256]